MTTVRKQKAGDQLTVGDWLAPGELLDGAAEVLFAHTYPASADRSRDSDGTHVQLVVRAQCERATSADIVAGNHPFELASEEDLAELREAAERTRKITDIRAFADWLEQNAWAPMPYSFDAGVHLDERHVGGPSVAEAYATVLRVAPLLDAKIEDRLDDRTAVRKSFGSVEYDVIAWHPGGRPAKPAPLAPSAVRQELLWKREIGSHGSLTAALEHAYDMALLEDNDRAKALVEASMTAADEGRVANPNLARYLAVREDRRRSALASAD